MNNSSGTTPISETRKTFYKRLLYIGICIIPIILFANNKDEFRLIPLPFFLFGIYQLLLIVGESQMIIDDFFPPKTYREKNTKPFDRFVNYFATALFFIGLCSLIFEIRNFDNTINGTRLFWTAGFVGIGLALVITLALKFLQPSVYDESKRRYTVHFGMFIGSFLFTTALAGFVNHRFAEPTNICKTYQIKRKDTSSSRSKEYFIFLIMDENKEERFSIDQTLYDLCNEGEQMELCMFKGTLGFYYVTEFKLASNEPKTVINER